MTGMLKRAAISLAMWLGCWSLAVAAPQASTSQASTLQASTSAPEMQQVLVLLRMPPEHARPSSDYAGSYGDLLGHSARERIARRLAREHGLQLVDGWPMPLLGVDCFIMAVPAGVSADDAAESLSREPAVAGAEVSRLFRTQGAAQAPLGDPLLAAQPVAQEWRLNDLHELATGRDVRVAVIDSMVDRAHPDLVGQVQVSQNFVLNQPTGPEAHGTAVAGVIAARADNGVGIAGVAPRARLMALRACWQKALGPEGGGDTVCDTLSLAKAMHYAIEHNAEVINLSLSGPADALLGALIDVATARGVKVVAAYDRALAGGGFPASHPGVVAVADEALASPPSGVYSAPGRDVPTTQPGGRWYLVNGSSYSAAHVSGLLALVRERRPFEQNHLALVVAKAGGGAIDACASLLQSRKIDCACARPR